MSRLIGLGARRAALLDRLLFLRSFSAERLDEAFEISSGWQKCPQSRLSVRPDVIAVAPVSCADPDPAAEWRTLPRARSNAQLLGDLETSTAAPSGESRWRAVTESASLRRSCDVLADPSMKYSGSVAAMWRRQHADRAPSRRGADGRSALPRRRARQRCPRASSTRAPRRPPPSPPGRRTGLG